MQNELTLTNFAEAFRVMLAAAEREHPLARRWHLVGAMPVTAAIECGRSFMRGSQPPVTVYQRDADDGYMAVLTVNEAPASTITGGVHPSATHFTTPANVTNATNVHAGSRP